jgi:hypothetical protein
MAPTQMSSSRNPHRATQEHTAEAIQAAASSATSDAMFVVAAIIFIACALALSLLLSS